MPAERRKRELLFRTNKEQVREDVADSSKFKSLGPDGFQLRILMDLIKHIPELLSVIFEKWGTGETPEGWRGATVIIFKKVNKEGSQTFQLDIYTILDKLFKQHVVSSWIDVSYLTKARVGLSQQIMPD